MTDLLPCPFCGDTTIIINDPLEVFYATCGNDHCGACTRLCKTREEVAKRWNTRAPTKADELLEKLLKLSGAPFHQALDEAREYLAKRKQND